MKTWKVFTIFIFLFFINQKASAYEIFRDSSFNVYIVPELNEGIDFKIVKGERVTYYTDPNNCNLIEADKGVAVKKFGIGWGDYFHIYKHGNINPLTHVYQQALPIISVYPQDLPNISDKICINGQIQGDWSEFLNGVKGNYLIIYNQYGKPSKGLQYYQVPEPGKYDFSIEYESANSRKLTLNSCGFYRIGATGKFNKDSKFMVNGTLYQNVSTLNEKRPYLCVRGIKYVPYN